MKNSVFWDVTLCGSCKNRGHLGFLRSVRRLLVTANVVPSSPILVTLMKDVLSLSETPVLTRATRCNIQKTPFLNDVWNWLENSDANGRWINLSSEDFVFYGRFIGYFEVSFENYPFLVESGHTKYWYRHRRSPKFRYLPLLVRFEFH
jgi:hypothetical protein